MNYFYMCAFWFLMGFLVGSVAAVSHREEKK
jgi:hypothetical protein